MNRRVQLNQFAKPICTPLRDGQHIGSKLVVSGWGRTSVGDDKRPKKLRSVEQVGKSPKRCAAILSMLSPQLVVDPSTVLCTELEQKRGPAKGDSGGMR